MDNTTQINSEIADNRTVINSELNGTVVNSEIFFPQATTINTEISDGVNLAVGTVLLEKYKVTEKMNIATGEASLYICESEGKKYVAKLYHREMAVKPEVIAVLSKINSKYVAKLYEYGVHNGKPLEIMQYFSKGSLRAGEYSFEEIRDIIVPSINNGLKVLHDAGIIHKDLKPSNVMLNDDMKSAAIIDFGISSVEENGNTVIVTKTGMTPEYSAPESFKGLFLEESDYFSFGITLYELYSGATPYKNLSAEQIAQYSSIQRIPFPDNMPEELKNLITALTYYDITNRNNKKNPNRRWTYEEVKKWCEGAKQSIPGEGITDNSTRIPAYKFMGQQYTKISELVRALTIYWKDGKKQLFRGLMSGFFKSFDPEIAGLCLDAEEEAAKTFDSDDNIYFRLLYKLDPDMTSFCWNGRIFESLMALGRSILEELNSNSDCSYYETILSNNVLSKYAAIVSPDNNELVKAVDALEKKYYLGANDKRRKRISLYTMGYVLSGQKIFRINQQEFDNVQELVSYMSLLLNDSYDAFEEFCNRLMPSNNELDVQFESWLIALGKREELNAWKRKLFW